MTTNKKNAPVDEAISDLTLDSVVGGTSAKQVGGIAWKQLQSAAHLALGGGEEVLGELVGQFSFIHGAQSWGQGATQTGEGNWERGAQLGADAMRLANNDGTALILGTFLSTVAGAGLGAATGTLLGTAGDTLLSSIRREAGSIPTDDPAALAQTNDHLNDLMRHFSERAQDDAFHSLSPEGEAELIHKLDQVATERLRSYMNTQAESHAADLDALANHLSHETGNNAEKIEQLRTEAHTLRESKPGDALLHKLEHATEHLQNQGNIIGVDESDVLNEVLKNPEGVLARELDLPPEVTKSLVMMKAQVMELSRESIRIAEEERSASRSGADSNLGSALEHDNTLTSHAQEHDSTWHNFSDTTRRINEVRTEYGGHYSEIPEMLWNRDMNLFKGQNEQLIDQLATETGHQNRLANEDHTSIRNAIKQDVGDGAWDLLNREVRSGHSPQERLEQIYHRATGHVRELLERDGNTYSDDQVHAKIRQMVAENHFAGILEGQDSGMHGFLEEQARKVHMAYEETQNQILRHELERNGLDAHYGANRPSDVPQTAAEGRTAGSFSYVTHDAQGNLQLEQLKVREFRVRDILHEHGLATGSETPVSQVMHDFGTQLHELKERGVINEQDATNLITTLQHSTDGNWELGKFQIGNGKSVVLENTGFHNALGKLSEEENTNIARYIRYNTSSGIIGPWMGTTSYVTGFLGGVGTLSADVYQAVNRATHSVTLSATTDSKPPNITDREDTLVRIAAIHEAFVQSVTSNNAHSILSPLKKEAQVNTSINPDDSGTADRHAEMYKLVTELISGARTAHDLGVPESFVHDLRQHMDADVASMRTQIREATDSALKETLANHPNWQHQLETQGHGSTSQEKIRDAADKVLNGDAHVSMPAGFMEAFQNMRHHNFLEMPETAILGLTPEGSTLPVEIGLSSQELAGTKHIMNMIDTQNREVQSATKLPDDEREAFFSYATKTALERAERDGVPKSLQPLFDANNKKTDSTAAIAMLENRAITGELPDAHRHAQEEFIAHFLEHRQQIIDSQRTRIGLH